MIKRLVCIGFILLGCAGEVEETPPTPPPVVLSPGCDCPPDWRLVDMASAKKTRAQRRERELSDYIYPEPGAGFDGMGRPAVPAISDIQADDTGGVIQQKEIRLGDRITLLDTGPKFGEWNQLPGGQRILDVGPSDMLERNPGSWVVTTVGRIVETSAAPSQVIPAIAYVEFGKGGITQNAEIDAWKSTFAVPADTLRVTIAYNQVGPEVGAGQIQDFPDAVEFKATAHRSLETGEAIPTRTYFVITDNPAGPSYDIPVPPFAVSWVALTNNAVTSGSTPFTNVQVRTDPLAPFVLDAPIDEVVESMARTFCFRPLPSGAGVLRITPQLAGTNQIIFRIGL